jgi:LuxR family maltose regulon positive regulatory protein
LVVVTDSTRHSVVARLASAPFGIVSAPAGFGKTSAIRESVGPGAYGPGDDSSATERSVVWARLGSAFRTDAETVARGLFDAAQQLGAPEPTAIDVEDRLGAPTVAALGEALHAVEGPCTLVLDDLHLVPSALQAELATVLHDWPSEERHLTLSTRAALSAVAAIWPIHEAAAIVQGRDLLLDHEQIAWVLEPDLVGSTERVARTTGGWARGVEVMRRHLQPDAAGVERAEVVLQALIASEIVPWLSAQDLQMLMMLSLGDSVPLSVAERALGQPHAARRLRGLIDETAFVVDDHGTVSLVPIFGQAFVQWIATNDPDAFGPIHLRLAQAWLDEPASAPSTAGAVHHLAESGEFSRAVEVLRQRWGVLYTTSRVELLVELMERVPIRYWADDAGCALLLGWANLLIGRGTRALELLQSPPLETPVGVTVKKLVWAQGVWWTTAPSEALQLIAEGRSRLDALGPNEPFPYMPGNNDAAAFHVVADGAEVRARFLLGDVVVSIDRLDGLLARPSRLEPITVAGLHAVGALIRSFRGDRNEALAHLLAADSMMEQIGAVDHYLMFPGQLARALLAVLAGDRVAAASALDQALRCASDNSAANFQRLCELVADMGGVTFDPPNPTLSLRAVRIPFVDSSLPVRTARRRADLGDAAGAASMLKGIAPNEFTLAAWLHVLLARHPIGEVRTWLSGQPEPVCAHGQVIRLLAEATLADTAAAATSRVRRAVALASDRRLLGVVCDAPDALWERPEIARLDLPMLVDARRLLSEAPGDDDLRFTTREIELLRMLATSATAAEIAERLYVSVNTVKWHKANIYRKLGVSGSRMAIARAVELGVLEAPDVA